MGQKTCVPVDCYEDVLVIEEYERDKPGAYQLKYYAPGVGDVRVGWRGPEEEEKERLGSGQRRAPGSASPGRGAVEGAGAGETCLRDQGVLQEDSAGEAHALREDSQFVRRPVARRRRFLVPGPRAIHWP